MAKVWNIYFKVRSIGLAPAMPLDMMRYDRCTPYSQEDVGELACVEVLRDKKDPPIEITFVHYSHGTKTWEPTRDRWRSFGWEVIEVQEPRTL